MSTVWKYDIPIYAAAESSGYAIQMPIGAQFLHSAVQHADDRISAWFEVRPDAETAIRHFRVFGTGHTLPGPPWIYRSTTLHQDGLLVLHLYEYGLAS